MDRLQSSSCYPYRLRSRNKTCVPASIFKLPPVPASFVQGKVCIGFNLSAATCTGFVLATKHEYRLQSPSCHQYQLCFRKDKCVPALIFELAHVLASFSQQNVCTGFSLPAATCIGFVLATEHVYRLQSASCHPYRFCYRKEKRGPASIVKLLPVPASFLQQNVCSGFNLLAATCTGFVLATEHVYRLQSSSCHLYQLCSRNKTCVPASIFKLSLVPALFSQGQMCVPASIFKLAPVPASFSQQNVCTGFNLPAATRTGFALQGKVCTGFNLQAATFTGFVIARISVYRLQFSSCSRVVRAPLFLYLYFTFVCCSHPREPACKARVTCGGAR